MEWKKICNSQVYECWAGGRKVILWSEYGKWKFTCVGLCIALELDKAISVERPMTYYEAQKAALGFLVICAEEEIKSLGKVINDCRGN